MCGIAGIVNREGSGIDLPLLNDMLLSIQHRGPDGSGIYRDSHAGLGHVRLSIIDIGGGHQPMANEDETLWITSNCEIYNYVELMAELKRRGHRFQTRSDTEVILHAFEEFGEDCVRHFNGQWSFAIWDNRRKMLFASRDRLGVRPFFYTQPGGDFLFASEIKALLLHPGVRRSIDLVGLDQIFTTWTTLPPRTIFQDVRELPPGHSLTWEAGETRVTQHWRPEYAPETYPRTQRQYEEQLLDLLIDATRLRLRSDVPVGAYLSGGLDSSLTTALIRRFTDSQLTTFSVAFDDPQFDESRFQQQVARHLGTTHETIRCSPADIGAIFPEVIRHTEKPILRTAPAPLFLLSRLVREQGYKVVITGEGADEMLGGYDIFKEAKLRRFWARQPGSQIRPQLLKRLYPYMQNLQSQSPSYLQAFFRVRPEDVANPFFSHLPRWDLTAKLKMFYSDAVRSELSGSDVYRDVRSSLPKDFTLWDPFCQSQYLETALLLPGYILSSQGDRMSMGHSVEGRFPFLDFRVAEFAARLPPRLKMRGTSEKDVLKRVAREFLPETITQRPKQPYRAPDATSFFGTPEAPLQFDYVEETLSRRNIAAAGIFNADAVELLVNKARQGKATGVKDNMALVGILSTQLVLDQFIHTSERGFDSERHCTADSAVCQ
jgi:asparagine synthase (glutamine-hydrolysing)